MATVRGADAVTLAREFLGVPYEWGGETPAQGFDCSGLVQYVYGRLGVHLPRVSHDQADAGVAIPVADAQPGDLIFSDWEGTPNSHVAIYSGDNRLIEAPQTGDVVHEIPFSANYRAHVDQVRRVGAGGAAAPGAVGGAAGGSAGASSAGAGAGNLGFGWGDIPGTGAIASAVDRLGATVGSIAKLFEAALWFTKPSNIRRVLVGTAGGAFVAVGIGFLVKAAS